MTPLTPLAPLDPLLCPVRLCRRDATAPLVRMGVVVAVVCPRHRDQIQLEDGEGWLMRADSGNHLSLLKE